MKRCAPRGIYRDARGRRASIEITPTRQPLMVMQERRRWQPHQREYATGKAVFTDVGEEMAG